MKIKTFLMAGGLALGLLAQPVMAGTLEDAADAAVRGEFATVLEILRPLAQQGDPEAQYAMGILYVYGRGVQKDYAEAAKWYRKAAENGYAAAQHKLGLLYFGGLGVPKDFAEAFRWFSSAAEQGDAAAQDSLASMYHLRNDNAKAVKLYQLAADQWYPDAQITLGQLYYRGLVVPKDMVKAHMWFIIAVASLPAAQAGQENVAINFRDSTAKKMTIDEIADAQKLAREWMAAHPKP
jgi:TPR repeat protein